MGKRDRWNTHFNGHARPDAQAFLTVTVKVRLTVLWAGTSTRS